MTGKAIKSIKNATINARIERSIKDKAEIILHKVGIEPADAVRMFYKQVLLHKGLPFNVRIPNKETIQAMQDANSGNTQEADSVEDIFKDI